MLSFTYWPLYPWETTLGSHWTRGMGSGEELDAVEKIISLGHLENKISIPWSFIPHLNSYTD
jgi:hypothetical protein